MNGLLIGTVLFFIVMPILAVVGCCKLYMLDDKKALEMEGKPLGTPLF